MIVNAREMLNQAKDNGNAIAQLNINNLEWTKFILEECEELKIPVILGVSEGAAKYMSGYNTVCKMINGLYEDLNITIPVAIHLDHAGSFESCKEAIDAGFTSVMIDASKEELDENIRITKEVVEYAKVRNVSVEAEVGHVGGEEDGIVGGILYAEVEDCIKFALATNIDFLAPALGSVHGLYQGDPKLDFERMKTIGEKTNLPLVLHGGTGIPDEQLRKAIESGVCKINFNTELQIAWTNEVRKYLIENAVVYDPRKVIKSGENALKEVVRNKVLFLRG